MAETNSSAQYNLAFWLKPALLLPLTIGGLCLVGINLVADTLLFSVLDPLLVELPENQRRNYLIIAGAGWQLATIVAMNLAMVRAEGETPGIDSDLSLFKAMLVDNMLLVWGLSILIVASLALAAFVTVSDTSPIQTEPAFIFFVGAGSPMLVLVGSVIKQRHPELWPQIQTRAARKLSWPSRKMLALLIFIFAFALIARNQPAMLSIWSALT